MPWNRTTTNTYLSSKTTGKLTEYFQELPRVIHGQSDLMAQCHPIGTIALTFLHRQTVHVDDTFLAFYCKFLSTLNIFHMKKKPNENVHYLSELFLININ